MGISEQLLEEIQKNNRLLMAVLALQAKGLGWLSAGDDELEERPELQLAAIGLTYQEIAEVLNKKPDAVRMMLARKRRAKKA